MTDAIPRTIDDFMRLKPAPADRHAEDLRHLRALRQAEVSADRLTGHPDWDVFLSYLQHAMNETVTQRDIATAKLNHPQTVDHNEMMVLKIIIAECNSRVATLAAVIALPKTIKEKGSKAKDLEEFMASLDTQEAA